MQSAGQAVWHMKQATHFGRPSLVLLQPVLAAVALARDVAAPRGTARVVFGRSIHSKVFAHALEDRRQVQPDHHLLEQAAGTQAKGSCTGVGLNR